MTKEEELLLKVNDELISIDKRGNLSNWPHELCYYTEILLSLV